MEEVQNLHVCSWLVCCLTHILGLFFFLTVLMKCGRNFFFCVSERKVCFEYKHKFFLELDFFLKNKSLKIQFKATRKYNFYLLKATL